MRCLFAPALIAGLLSSLAASVAADEFPPPPGHAAFGHASVSYPPHCPPAAPCQPPCNVVCEPVKPEKVFTTPRNGIFFDYLYLSATDTDVVYALPVDGFAAPQVLTGRAGVVSPDYDSGFRVGGMAALDEISSVGVTYWWWESESQDNIAIPGGPGFGPVVPGFLQATLADPGTFNVAADSLAASARYDIDFQMVDVDYRRLLSGSPTHLLDLVVGARWGQLDQDFQAQYTILGSTVVDADIDFDGIGPRIGLDGEWHHACGLMAYSRGFANFLVGDFQQEFRQTNIFAGQQSLVTLEDDRIVPVLELELGVGWTCMDGALRATAGYYVASWYNTPTVSDLIEDVQARQFNNADDDDDGLTFNGLTARVEFRY